MRALGPDGVIVNIARGTLVDEQALIEALRTGTILAAGLDVYENEPNVPAELIALDNAVLLPHVGSASVKTRRAMAAMRRRQPRRLVGRQAAADAGAGDAVAGDVGEGRVEGADWRRAGAPAAAGLGTPAIAPIPAVRPTVALQFCDLTIWSSVVREIDIC